MSLGGHPPPDGTFCRQTPLAVGGGILRPPARGRQAFDHSSDRPGHARGGDAGARRAGLSSQSTTFRPGIPGDQDQVPEFAKRPRPRVTASLRRCASGRAASMGPRPLGRGILSALSTIATTLMLQWGHDLSVVESRRSSRPSRGCRTASMGPRPLGRGISKPRSMTCAKARASMGPRPLGRGIPVIWRAQQYPASWLQWGHDLSVVESTRAAPGSCSTGLTGRFIGATTSRSWNPSRTSGSPTSASTLQWGHDLSVVESWAAGVAQDSITWLLQWGHDLSVVESQRPSAPSASRWPASMGPRPLGRGIARRCLRSRTRRSCFNGATTSRSWNPSAPEDLRGWEGLLQWGHDLSVVES